MRKVVKYYPCIFPYIFCCFAREIRFKLLNLPCVVFDFFLFSCVAFDAVIFGSPDSYGLLGDQRLC